jgi:hypothetical protein
LLRVAPGTASAPFPGVLVTDGGDPFAFDLKFHWTKVGTLGPVMDGAADLNLIMTGQDTVEVERKYEVEQGAPLPELAMLAGVDRVGTPEEHNLDAVYFDTGDLTLAAHGITLRRRSGGDDAGWHLKLPLGAGERREMTEPVGIDPDTAPERLRRLVLVHTRDRALVPRRAPEHTAHSSVPARASQHGPGRILR